MKSHISIEQRVCPVCGVTHDTGAILLDKRLRASMEKNTVTGWDLCPEHQKLHDEGYVALVGCYEAKSEKHPSGGIRLEGAYRTGKLIHLRREVAEDLFNTSFVDTPLTFCEDEVIDKIIQMSSQSDS